MRILFFGDGAWATKSLRALLETEHEWVGLVVRQRPTDDELIAMAQDAQMPVIQPSDVNAPSFLDQVSQFAPDLNLSVSYDQILRKGIRETAPRGFINFHAGMLPRYRGRNVINWALINGEEEIGITSHFVDDGIDAGDIILQRALPIHWTDTYAVILDRVVNNFPSLVVDTVALIDKGDACCHPQDHASAIYFSGREDGDEWLNWEDTSRNLHNKVRAISRPAPGARTYVADREVIVWSAFYDPSWPSYIATPGQVVGHLDKGVVVKTGDSTLLLTEVQFSGLPAEQPRWRIGTRLGINLGRALRTIGSPGRSLVNSHLERL